MKKIILVVLSVVLLGVNAFAAGDLIVDGQIGIGTSSPSANLEIYSSNPDSTTLVLTGPLSGASSSGAVEWRATDTSAFWHLAYRGSLAVDQGNLSFWYYNGTNWLAEPTMSLTADGKVGLMASGTTGHKLYVIGSAFASGGFYSQSDGTFKKGVETIKSALTVVHQLRGVSYKWKKDEYKEKDFPDGTHYGVIAQEIEQVLPDLVKTDEVGDKAVNYTELIALLIEAIKEQQAQIDTLKMKVN
jgi:hypothetical protein